MEEENKNESTTEVAGIDYIQTIEDLKKNSVPKAEYEKLVQEQRKLMDAFIQGKQPEVTEEAPVLPSVDELRKDLFTVDCNLSNLDYCTKALQLRTQILDQGGDDIFVASNSNLTPTQFDYDRAKAVAEVMQDCIEYAKGDSEAFTNELMRRTNDVAIPGRGRR